MALVKALDQRRQTIVEAVADQYRDPASMANCARIAAHIFGRHQVDIAMAKRKGG
jgi:hypothetical protein